MLHVKLPKGKTATACRARAAYLRRRLRLISAWRFDRLAVACKASVGDVYLSADLWAKLARFYNA